MVSLFGTYMQIKDKNIWLGKQLTLFGFTTLPGIIPGHNNIWLGKQLTLFGITTLPGIIPGHNNIW